MLDVAGAVCTHLREQPALMLAFADQVFADVAPTDVEPPFAVLRTSSAQRPFADVETWDVAGILVDVVGDPLDVPGLHTLAGLIRDELESLRGVAAGGILIQSVDPTNGVFGYDPTFTPVLPRWVLSASMVVRSITTEGVVA